MNKTCPLTREGGEYFSYCRRDECGRWDAEHECCCDLSSARALWTIAERMRDTK